MAQARPAILKTLGLEGDWSNHPHDKGGPTFMGISERRYPGWPARLRAMPREKAVDWIVETVKRDYWDTLLLDQVEDGDVAFEMFDTLYNGGNPARMAQRLCRALGRLEIRVDGQMGPMTIRAINDLVRQSGGHDRILKGLNCQQGERFITLTEKDDVPPEPGEQPTHNREFFKGWLDRRVQLRPTD